MTQEARGGLIGAGVLTLLGVLAFGLLLPAVSKVREAAARSTCVGHFKQLALACHNYSEAYPDLDKTTRFPPGTRLLAGVPPERRLSWMVEILPFVERAAEHRAFRLDAPADHPTNALAGRAAVRHFLCPASDEFDTLRGKPFATTLPSQQPTHLVGVAGLGADAAGLPMAHPRAGAMGYDWRRPLNPAGFPDGLSYTLLLIEVGSDPGPWAVGGPGTLRGVEADAVPPFGPTRLFGGFHAADTFWFRKRRFGCNAAMADGGTRFFTPDTDPVVLAALATAGGGEPIPAE